MNFIEIEDRLGSKHFIKLDSIVYLSDIQSFSLLFGDDTIYHDYKIVFKTNVKDYEIYLDEKEYNRIKDYINKEM